MNEVSGQRMHHILVVGTVVGFVTIFLFLFVAFAVAGVPVGAAAAVAIFPAVMGSWFYGCTIMFLRAVTVDARRSESPVRDAPASSPSTLHTSRQAA